jgi:hypothetical protein
MLPKAEAIEERITKASEAMDRDPKLKGAKAIAYFGASYDRLIARRRGRPTSNSRGRHNKKLLVPQDKSLRDYLLMLYTSRRSPNLEAI